MKLLFIENRYKTFFFEPIAKNLSNKGYDVHWLIQNKEFTPSGNFHFYIIDYPKDTNYDYLKDEAVEKVIQSDRQINHFKKKDKSYFYYYNEKIKNYLESLRPDFVFGEATAFHELLTIQNCKDLNILYLNPSTCRYPVGRFSFYKYDTLEPFLGSNENLTKEEATNIIDQIVNRKKAPDYMNPVSVSKYEIIQDKLTKTVAYYKGERYNTPNPLIKFKLQQVQKNNIKNWNIDAEKEILKTHNFKILYPLQMQPEANIDVWGRKYRNQTQLIKNISQCLPENTILYVKPNPKSKYELSPELVSLVKQTPNIRHLHHSTKMDGILPNIDLVITVTGTIAIECILSNKPVVTLIKTINNQAKNCKFINSLSRELPGIMKDVMEKTFKTLSLEEKIDFINILNKTSYKGIISDPFSDKYCIKANEIHHILVAFENFLFNFR